MPEFLDKITESIDKSLRAVTSQAREVVETTKLKLGNCWGQLGLGDTEDRLTPTKARGLPDGSPGPAVRTSGLTPTKAPGLSKVKAILAGDYHSLAFTESGEVYAWGANRGGQLGLREGRLTPTKVPGLPKVKAIAAGWRHSLALTESGEVYAWGRNDQGQLGLGDRQNRLTPAKVAVFR